MKDNKGLRGRNHDNYPNINYILQHLENTNIFWKSPPEKVEPFPFGITKNHLTQIMRSIRFVILVLLRISRWLKWTKKEVLWISSINQIKMSMESVSSTIGSHSWPFEWSSLDEKAQLNTKVEHNTQSLNLIEMVQISFSTY